MTEIMKKKVTLVQEAQIFAIKKNTKRLIPIHIIIKYEHWAKCKERIVKAARETQYITYMGVSIRLPVVFLSETLHSRRDWHKVFKVMKNMYLNSKLLYPACYNLKLKTNKIYCHQTSISRNYKGTTLKTIRVTSEKCTLRDCLFLSLWHFNKLPIYNSTKKYLLIQMHTWEAHTLKHIRWASWNKWVNEKGWKLRQE